LLGIYPPLIIDQYFPATGRFFVELNVPNLETKKMCLIFIYGIRV